MKVAYIDLNSKTIKNEYITNENELKLNEDDLIFKSPQLVGKKIIGANRIHVYSKDKKSSSGGHFSHYLKCNGYDFLVIKNKSENNTSIYINDTHVTFYDGVEILNNEDVEIAQIKHAGINKLDFSKIMFKNDKSCGKDGLGKLMGEKNLKAIILNKKENLDIENYEDIEKINIKISNKIGEHNTKNYFKNENYCYGCCLNCESTAISKILKYDFDENEAKIINDKSNEYGMDSIATSKIIKSLRQNKEFKNKSIEECINFIICNENYKDFIDKDEEYNSKYKKFNPKNKKEKNELEIILEEYGFCKFLIKKNILDKEDIEYLISKSNFRLKGE